MIQVFSGNTANDVWYSAAKKFINHDSMPVKPSRIGDTKELLHVGFSIEDPRQRWVFSRIPPINIAFALAEVVWIITGRDDAKFLTYWNTQLPKYVGTKSHLHGAYGFRLRKYFGIDQLIRAYHSLRNNLNSRQVILQIWDGKADLPDNNGNPADDDIPCNIISSLKVVDGKLEWFQFMRSNDLKLGTPYNFIQFTYLQEILAGWLNLDLGSYNQISDSLHMYLRDLKDIKKSKKTNNIKNVDSVAMPLEDSELSFQELGKRIEILIDDSISINTLKKIANWKHSAKSFQNILWILAAESARRKKWYDIAQEFTENCKNPSLRTLYRNWYNRVSRF